MIRTFLLFCLCLHVSTMLAQKAEHLPPEVNSEYEEREPTLSPDGKTLYFWRRNMPSNVAGIKDAGDIWIATQDENEKWQKAIHPGPPLNSTQQNFVWQVSKEHDTLWLNRVSNRIGQKDAGVAYCIKNNTDGSWGEQKGLTIKGYAHEGAYKDYFLTKDKTLIITNVADDSYGGTDLYVCFPLNDSTWSTPINMGDVLNTPADEDAPYLSPDGKFLFFDSNGHGGRGNHDIFFSQRLDNTWTNWSKPQNIGSPINTAGYDFDFQMSADGRYAYWCSETNTYGSHDIFRLDLKACKDITVFPEGSIVKCKGDSVILEVGFTMGKDVNYQWYKDSKPVLYATERWLNVKESGVYFVVRRMEGCTETSKPKPIFFHDIPEAQISASVQWLCPEDSTPLRIQKSYETNYQWTKNDIAIPGATALTYYANTPGIYRVKAANKTCAAYSNAVKIEKMQAPLLQNEQNANKGTKEEVLEPEWFPAVLPKFEAKDFIVKSLDKVGKGNYLLSGIHKGEKILNSYDYKGNLLWSKTEKLAYEEEAFYMNADGEGNVVMASDSRFLTKYSPEGKILWQKNTKNPTTLGMTIDANGNIFTMGRFTDTLELEGETLFPAGRGSVFLTKHNPFGKLEWMRVIAVDGMKDDFGARLGADCIGNVYMIGEFERIANFGSPILRAALNLDNFFLAKFTADGKQDWVKRIAVSPMPNGTGDMKIDCHGFIYLVLNNRIYKYNNFGNPTWEDAVYAPSSVIKKVRIAQTGGEYIYLCGITRSPDDYFLTRHIVGSKEPMTALWQGQNANKDDRQEPTIFTDDDGDLFFAGNVRGRALIDASPSPQKAPTLVISRYGFKDNKMEMPPLTICNGDSVKLFTKVQKDLTYRWTIDGNLIPNATQPTFYAKKAGDYRVLVSSPTAKCAQSSEPQRVNDCKLAKNEKKEKPIEKNEPKTPDVVSTPSVIKPEPKPITPAPKKEPKKPELVKYSQGGKPQSILDRRVKQPEEVIVHNKKVKLLVWDHGAQDNDTLSLNLNGVWVLEHFGLQKAKKAIEVELNEGDNFIILYAHNLGNVPPNTISMSISDGTVERSLKLESNLNACGMLNIKLE
ncbi:MAG: hypothetical protein ACKVTZ_08645 [Bacteroidia bacterium]